MSALSLSEATTKNPVRFSQRLADVVEQVGTVILGKEHAVRLAVTCMVARGHLLIEDVPGVGKTTLSQVLARAFGLSFQRIQFTSDLLPADILGISVYQRRNDEFRFHPGPIFSQLVLADEVNRATPKTQSALLEAMQEHQVTQDGTTRPLPEPFFVVATQNPTRQIGTFPLPESQLDRFLMRIEIGYPDPRAERELLRGTDRQELLDGITPQMSADELLLAQRDVPLVHVADALLDYAQAIIAYTRNAPEYETGLSPRAGIALLRCAQAWAVMDHRAHVQPEDIQAILAGVVGHRLAPRQETGTLRPQEIAAELIARVPIP